MLLIPVALMAILDLAGGLLTSGIPDTAAAWRGFFTMIAVIAGAVAGLTVRRHHSMRRKRIHLLVVAIAVILLARALFFPILPDGIPLYPFETPPTP